MGRGWPARASCIAERDGEGGGSEVEEVDCRANRVLS